jgi:hypothetical protein
MDEILQKLLESELLSEDVKAEISQKWQLVVEAKMAELKESALLEVRAELAEQWTKERDALVESLEKFVDEQITEELNELKSDIERFRDLEAEYAGKIVAEKAEMAVKVQEDLDQLVDKIDSFFEIRLTEEFEELKEDIEVVKQNHFGRQIFEAFVNEFSKSFVDEESIQAQLQIAESKLEDAGKKIAKLEADKKGMLRESKMAEVLKPLSGSKREQMSFILQNVETAKLEEAYNQFIGRVLKEEKQEPAAATQVISEGKDTKVVTGEQIDEGKKEVAAPKDSKLDSLRALAGIGNK